MFLYVTFIFILQFSVVDVEPPQESGANDKQSLGRLAFSSEQASKKKHSNLFEVIELIINREPWRATS